VIDAWGGSSWLRLQGKSVLLLYHTCTKPVPCSRLGLTGLDAVVTRAAGGKVSRISAGRSWLSAEVPVPDARSAHSECRSVRSRGDQTSSPT
jgi:hypothetical protein